ncbi:GTP-Rho binding exocyst subunit [Lithohypha guttulata]|uniref:GTP-Rho binding exocyst subunit n=1 Tax=Lithohypha guttulata TaxID=1690604 RepID=UPI002DDF382F|nr:GTP-Rho binding exocyst subunit [Lithohypha guttulata]
MNSGSAEYSSYGGPRSASRPVFDPRTHSQNNSPAMQPQRGPPSGETNQSRAARYEDEKRRIIDSCFSKKEADGVLLESYITHVRVTEDALYPSSPPPPDSAPSNKKNRLILVAVRRSGRVRVHKARENPNGSFSIGKTWPLDELTSIQIYASINPASERDVMAKQWAGELGFTVMLGKPYYWHAPTAKERDFFIASLLKIYKKYTSGKTPELIGFLPHQMDQLGANSASRTPSATISQSSPPPPADPPPLMPAAISQRPQSPRFSPAPPNDFEQSLQAHLPRPEYPSATRDGTSSPMLGLPHSPASADRRMPSRENLRRGSDGPSTGYPPREPVPAMPNIPRQQLTPQPLDSRNSQTSSASREQQGFPASVRPMNGHGPSLRQPSVVPSHASSEYLPTTLAVRDRSVSSAHSSERPTTATSDTTSVASKFQPSHDSLAPPERKRATGPRTEVDGAHSQSNGQSVSQPGVPVMWKEEENRSRAPSALLTEETTKEPKENNLAKAGYFNAVTMPSQPEPDSSQLPTLKTAPVLESPTITPEPQTAEPEAMSSSERQDDEHRPGLGPMIKKKNAADAFRKAAFAASAFKPRQGGGAARLKALAEEGKKGNEPDGITGVVPAPLFRGMSSDSVGSNRPATPGAPSAPSTPGLKEQPPVLSQNDQPPKVNLQRTATDDSIMSQSFPQPDAEKLQEVPKTRYVKSPPMEQPKRPATPEKARSRSPQRRKRQRQDADIAKYSSSLGIDPRIFEGRGADFNDLLTEFGWDGKLDPKSQVNDLEAEVRREIGRAQATGWLGHVEQQDTKVLELARAFDRAIEECEELDGLFTLYSHELDTLAADIEYIEAQSQGLQVQTANQKLLQKELRNLLSTLRISNNDLQDLQYGALDDPQGVANVEHALATLYTALIQIDPNIRYNKLRQVNSSGHGISPYANNDLGEMRAVREKKEEYADHSQAFIRRFCQHMKGAFKTLDQTHDDSFSVKTSISDSNSSLATQRTARQDLWLYNGMVLFVREVNSYEWKTLIKSYEMSIRGLYQDQFRTTAMSSRSDARKPSGEEQEALFTYQEKDRSDDSLTSTAARKLTVKRGKTVKNTGLKTAFSNRHDGKPDAHEVFQQVLEQQAKVVAEEQNFMVCFFHLSTQSNADFIELVSTKAPAERRLPNLNTKIPFEPDKSISSTIQASIEAIYSFWLQDLQNQLDWVLKMDQLQGVGVLCALEHVSTLYEDSNQEFITSTIRTLHGRLKGLFNKFVEGQVKAVEETKVKLKKRKGIISFMRTFPFFSSAVESMIPDHIVEEETLEIRFILNDAYNKILRAMWESLTFIAKDDSTTGGTAHSTAPASGDPEDKEALNYHILLIENMNHYIEEVETHHNIVLEEWKEKASQDMFTHLTQYTDAVIRRPLGKWLDFVESTEAMMKTNDSLQSISSKPSHSRSTCKKIIKSYDSHEIRKGIETLKKRVEKHFGDVDDPSTMSKSLIMRVLDECSARYLHAHDRMRVIIDRIYDGGLEIDWRKEEVSALFKR